MLLQFTDRIDSGQKQLFDWYRWWIGLLFAGLLLLLFVFLLLWLLWISGIIGLLFVLFAILYRLIDRLLFLFRLFWLAILSGLFVLLASCGYAFRVLKTIEF